MEREKALQWEFDVDFNGKFVICYYITQAYTHIVYACFDDLEQAESYMNEQDLWDDYYIYEIIDGYAYAPMF